MTPRVALTIGQLTHGGAERQLYELAVRLRGEGFEPVVICLSEATDPYEALLDEAGIQVQCLSRRRSFEFRRLWALARILRQIKPSVVHGFLFIGNAYAFFASRVARVPAFLASVRNYEPGRSGLIGFVDRLVLSRSSAVLVNAQYLKEVIGGGHRMEEVRIHVVPNGLDLSRFEDITPLIPENDLVVGTISLFKKQKRIPFMLEVAARVHSARPDVRFRFVGDGPEHAFSLVLRDRMGLAEVVEMPGRTDDVPGELARFNVFLLASDREGMPNVVLEAMAAGRPVVASDVVGTRDVVREGTTGMLFPAHDAAAAAERVIQLLDDPALATAYGQAGREEARSKYTAQVMAERTARIYRELLEAAAHGQRLGKGSESPW